MDLDFAEANRAQVAYLILGHQRGRQVVQLAERICELSQDARVLIHWDRSSRQSAPGPLPDRASLTDGRVSANWGSWSLVEAFLILLAEAEQRFAPRWSVLISGEDWPLRDLASWEAELDGMNVDAMMESEPVKNASDHVGLASDEVRRYEDAWLRLPRPSWSGAARVSDALVRRAEAWSGRARRYPAVMDFYGRGYAVAWRHPRFPVEGWELQKGSQWLTCGPRASRALLTAPEAIRRHFRGTLIPDESFAHTMLRNTPGLRLAAGPTSYAPWSHFGRLPHLVLQTEDVPEALASRAPFARKIGEGELGRIVDHLDALVKAERVASAPPPTAGATGP